MQMFCSTVIFTRAANVQIVLRLRYTCHLDLLSSRLFSQERKMCSLFVLQRSKLCEAFHLLYSFSLHATLTSYDHKGNSQGG